MSESSRHPASMPPPDVTEWPVYGALARACALSWGDDLWHKAVAAYVYDDRVHVVREDGTTFTRGRDRDHA